MGDNGELETPELLGVERAPLGPRSSKRALFLGPHALKQHHSIRSKAAAAPSGGHPQRNPRGGMGCLDSSSTKSVVSGDVFSAG